MAPPSSQHRMSVASAITLALSLTLATAPTANAQMDSNGCLLLTGSQACRGFQSSYVAPYDRLSSQFSFLSDIWDVQSFDDAVFRYLNRTYPTRKLGSDLGCSGASDSVIRWERTALCSRWVNHADSVACASSNAGQSVAKQQIACQGTCDQFSNSAHDLINNATLCPGGGASDAQSIIATDLQYCLGGNTSSSSIPTQSSGACVNGVDNENACGFGNSTVQLCAYCDGNRDSCCGSVDLRSVCGFESSADPSGNSDGNSNNGSSTGSGSSGSSGGSSSSGGKGGLSGGAIAGIVIGVVAGLAILGLLLWFFLRRRKRSNSGRHMLMSPNEKQDAVGSSTGITDRTNGGFTSSSDTPPIASNYATAPGGTTGTGTGTGTGAGTGAGIGAGAAAASAAGVAGAAALAHNRSTTPTGGAVRSGPTTSPGASPRTPDLRNNAAVPTTGSPHTPNARSNAISPGSSPNAPLGTTGSGHSGAGLGAAAGAGAAAVAGGAALAHHNRSQRDSSPASSSPTTIRNTTAPVPAPAPASPSRGSTAGASHPAGPRANPFHDSAAPSIPPGAAAAELQGSRNTSPTAFPTPHTSGYSGNSSPAGGIPVGGIFQHDAAPTGTSYNAFTSASPGGSPNAAMGSTGSSHNMSGLATGAAVAAGAAGVGAGAAHHAHSSSRDGVPAPTGQSYQAQAPQTAAPQQQAAAAPQAAPAPSAVRTLPRVEDSNKPGAWIVTGAHVSVLHDYPASLPDELTLKPGMQLEVQELFDDGWGRAKVLGGDPAQVGRVGQFPSVCVTSA